MGCSPLAGKSARCRSARSSGLLRGRLELPRGVRTVFSGVATRDFESAVSDDFSGDAVRDIDWSDITGVDVLALLPQAALLECGLRIAGPLPRLYATCGVESHVDEMDGLSVAVVLHSDGFRFRQGGCVLKLRAGDWFVFDDSQPHEVVETDSATTLLVLTAPVRGVERV